MIASKRFWIFVFAAGFGMLLACPSAQASFVVNIGETPGQVQAQANGHPNSTYNEVIYYEYVDKNGNVLGYTDSTGVHNTGSTQYVTANGINLQGGNDYHFSNTTPKKPFVYVGLNNPSNTYTFTVIAKEQSTGTGSSTKITGEGGGSSGVTGAFGDFSMSSFLASSNSTTATNGTGGVVNTIDFSGVNGSKENHILNITTTDTGFTKPNSPQLREVATLTSGFKNGWFTGNFNAESLSYHGTLNGVNTGAITVTQAQNPTTHKWGVTVSPSSGTQQKVPVAGSNPYTLGGTLSLNLHGGDSADPHATTSAFATPEPASILSILSGLSVLGGCWLKRRKRGAVSVG